MELDVRHLRLIVAVSDTGSLSAAARTLGIAQPSVSNQLRRIETALGRELFERSARGVVPTEPGRAVLRHARGVLEQVDRIQDSSGAARAPATVRLRTFVLPFEPLLPVAQYVMPGTQWEIVAGTEAEGFAAVACGEADLYFGLRLDREPPPGVAMEEILQEYGWAQLPVTHRLADRPVVELADLADEVWAVRSYPELVRSLQRECRRAGFEPDVRYRVGETQAVTTLVASGAAVALTSPVADSGADVVLKQCIGTQGHTWTVAYRPGTVPRALVQTFADLVRWSYAMKARTVPALMEVIPAEYLSVALPAPLKPLAATE